MITGPLNPFEVMLVTADLEEKGIKYYDMRPGNDCIWVNYGLVNCYYIFRDGKIADIQFD
jgi:hypothetical protein